VTYELIAALADDIRGDRLRQAERHQRMAVIRAATSKPASRRAKLAWVLRWRTGILFVETGLHLISRTGPPIPTSPSGR
jgi:hypothetical protein